MSSPAPFEPLPLVWTVGFSGKRRIPLEREPVLRAAIDKALVFLTDEAREQSARLTALSSIARGADVLFAEACTQPRPGAGGIPWKGLVPYDLETFLYHDMRDGGEKPPMDADERDSRLCRAHACVSASYPGEAESTLRGPLPAFERHIERNLAYLEVGYRIVDEADVIILAVNGEEFAQLEKASRAKLREQQEWKAKEQERIETWKAWMSSRAVLTKIGIDKELLAKRPALPPKPVLTLPQPAAMSGGTIAVARYAFAANRPCIILNADDADPWEHRLAVKEIERGDWFCDPDVTPAVQSALERCDCLAGVRTARDLVESLLACLDGAAKHHQTSTQGGLRQMLRFHLGASVVAALFASVLAFHPSQWAEIGALIGCALAAFAAVEPVLAWRAKRIDDRLHHQHTRDHWVKMRIFAEVCRSALCRWELPLQPLDAMDEEDFPKIKRLIRSLRLLREIEGSVPRKPGSVRQGEPTAEAVMREACRDYAEKRLHEQAEYFEDKEWEARNEEDYWHASFRSALNIAIAVGVVLVVEKLRHVFSSSHGHGGPEWPFTDIFHWLEAVVIIAPFYATFALGQITISDCRRRKERYEEMHHYLTRLSRTLLACEATPSRLRIIEHAERMMIEEQHEWFSVTRNYSV